MPENSIEITPEMKARLYLTLLMADRPDLLFFILLPSMEADVLKKASYEVERRAPKLVRKGHKPFLQARKFMPCNKPQPRPTAE